ncbi:MAG: RNA 2',3'-cyclic phosphodiesterase [Nitrosopumilaceae archaeon]
MRTFVAVEVHNDNVLSSISKLQSDFEIKATAVSKQNMHFTLLFLGEISEETAENVKKVLATVTFKPIDVSFTHVGAFPNLRFPRVIWIGTDEASAKQLVELAVQVEQKLIPLGFRSDKPFKPHLTIFRVKNKTEDISKKLERFKETNLGRDIISELKFKQSILTPNGPIYSDLKVVNAQ